jgi:uncharacterized protein YecE (DUF72 family)
MAAGRVKVGTSGWSYGHWEGLFYPAELRPSERLAFYARRFETVEVNATFYNLPSESAVRGWRDATPEGFSFSVKGSRLVTHYRRLQQVDEALAVFYERIALLGEKLEAVLWQLPPSLGADPGLLAHFLGLLPAGRPRTAVEFRDESWLDERTFAVLRERNVACVHVSSDAMPVNLTVTADFVYVRFHGLAALDGRYEREALEPWAEFLRAQSGLGRDCYVYFNNDFGGHAVRDALRLRDMLGQASA